MSDKIFQMVAEMIRRSEPGAMATVIRAERSVPRHAGSKMIVRADGSTAGSVGGGNLEAKVIEDALLSIADGQCRRVGFDLTGADGVCGGNTEVFIEPILSRVPFIVMGAGHVGRAIMDLGVSLPYRFTAIDDRTDFLSDLVDVDTNLALVEDDQKAVGFTKPLEITSQTVVLICTRNHELDGESLDAVLAAEEAAGRQCAYIGMVGSRTKAAHVGRRYTQGTPRAERFRQVHTPVGLAIGAETPHEIAVSILAEVMALTRKVDTCVDQDASPTAIWRMKFRPGGSGK
jgi:xanthine dehydrogenase accessory factor